MNGGAEEQTLYTLDGFQINDPLTGRFESRLSVESVREVEMTPLNPAEFGKGVAGTLAIKTSAGDDKWRYSGNKFHSRRGEPQRDHAHRVDAALQRLRSD